MLLIQQALAIVSGHDARIWQMETSAKLLRLHLSEAASALFRASVQWEEKGVLAIECPQKEDAKALRGQWRVLAKSAQPERVRRILLGWAGCDRPYPIPVNEFSGENGWVEPVRADKPELAALQIGERILSSVLPMSLVDMELDMQVWTNQPLADLIGSTLEESRRLNMRSLWVSQDGADDGLEYVKQMLRQQGQLQHEYETQLTPQTRAQFRSGFELVLDGRYRLTTIYQAEPIAVTA